jgi:hypothetical protein
LQKHCKIGGEPVHLPKVVNRQQSGPLSFGNPPSKIEVRLRRKHPAPNRVRKTFDLCAFPTAPAI